VSQAKRAKTRAVVISLAIHAGVFAALMNAPEIRLPQAGPSEYQLAIAGKEEKLVWYQFNKKLPSVKPSGAQAEEKLLRAEINAQQEIVASPQDAPKRPQIVWTDAPVLPEMAPLESPNVLAVKLPPARIFVPPDIVKPPPADVEIATDAPQVAAPALSPVALPQPAKFVRQFVPPPQRVPEKLKEVAPPPETPTVAGLVKPDNPSVDLAIKLPAKPFTPPAATPKAPPKQVSVDPAPQMTSNLAPLNAELLQPKDLNLAVVGLKPVDKPAPVPAASSPAQFSAGPTVRAEGATSTGSGKGVTVPDVFVRGEGEAKPDLIAQAFAAPTASATVREAMRTAPGGAVPQIHPQPETPPRPLQSGAVQVSGAPDPRFSGREVYMMAIQMPNLTSYSGSWLMWYADRTQRELGLAPVAPPVAWRKVDPKYIASAISDRVEGKVRLACVIGKDGHVSTIEIVNGIDDRLDQSAEEALSKWEFTPATRHGEPVEVDVLVEIPFKLEPKTPVRF
jgi:TonB family protein